MAVFRAEIRSGAGGVIRTLLPSVRRAVKAAIRAISADPMTGEPLHGELQGRFKYRVRRYRVIYRIDRQARIVHVIAVGHRRSIYEELAEKLEEER